MSSMADMVWQSDVDLTINRLSANKHELEDPVYFYQTVDNVEAMRSPDGKKPLTLTALKEWEEHCKSGPREKDAHDTADHHSIDEDVEDRLLHHGKKTFYPRRPRQVH